MLLIERFREAAVPCSSLENKPDLPNESARAHPHVAKKTPVNLIFVRIVKNILGAVSSSPCCDAANRNERTTPVLDGGKANS